MISIASSIFLVVLYFMPARLDTLEIENSSPPSLSNALKISRNTSKSLRLAKHTTKIKKKKITLKKATFLGKNTNIVGL